MSFMKSMNWQIATFEAQQLKANALPPDNVLA
jgi:hypothetical protein